MKSTDERYPAYLIYQREYQRNRRETDYEFRLKRSWAVSKCYHMKKERVMQEMNNEALGKENAE